MKKDFKEIVLQGIGEASMCWSNPPEGTFDSARAIEIADEIVEAAKHPTCDSCLWWYDGGSCDRQVSRWVDHDFYCKDHEQIEEIE